MKNNQHNIHSTQDKVKCINESINHLVNCMKSLEDMRSYNYLSNIDEEDLEKVVNYMQQLENSIERLSNLKGKDSGSKELIKAVGKNKKFWVSKPNNSNNEKDITSNKPQEKTNKSSYHFSLNEKGI